MSDSDKSCCHLFVKDGGLRPTEQVGRCQQIDCYTRYTIYGPKPAPAVLRLDCRSNRVSDQVVGLLGFQYQPLETHLPSGSVGLTTEKSGEGSKASAHAPGSIMRVTSPVASGVARRLSGTAPPISLSKRSTGPQGNDACFSPHHGAIEEAGRRERLRQVIEHQSVVLSELASALGSKDDTTLRAATPRARRNDRGYEG